MPTKKDYSNLMTNGEFWNKWLTWEPLVYRVVLGHIRQFPLQNRPGTGEVGDIVGDIRETMHRLGIFARWNPGVQSELKYVGCQVLSIVKHMWQDHCRVNRRIAIRISTVGYDGDTAGSKELDMAVVDNETNQDPDFQWSHGLGAADDTTSERMVIDAIAAEVAAMPVARKTTLAAQALKMLRRSPILAAGPTTAALAVAMCLEEATATAVRDVLRTAARYVAEDAAA
jgi:hypothetical protein